jgi:hypothetical protein
MKSVFKSLSVLAITLLSFAAFAQNKMQSLDELINKTDPAWPLVQKWIDSAKNKVEVLEVDSAQAKQALFNTQISTYSTLGAVIYNSGGIMVDNGWLRILGSGSAKLNRSVPEWNKGKTIQEFGDKPDYFLVADDAAGGFFAINYGAFGKDLKNVYYLAPDNLRWEPLGFGYSEFIRFCLDGDLSSFYKGLRWSTWDKFIAKLDGSQSYSFYPYLWTKEGADIEKCKRKLVTTEEVFKSNLENRKTLQTKSATESE